MASGRKRVGTGDGPIAPAILTQQSGLRQTAGQTRRGDLRDPPRPRREHGADSRG